ncbi:DUF3105 domain-containing protein [Candidatus Uhrbacteria bacterium]|nr:DUF3105 domain-containing protein [Candidatus Uhrbacteria bacterium]
MRKTKIIRALSIIIPIILVVALFAWAISRPQPENFVASQGNQHIETIDTSHESYSTSPPTSGPHIGSIARWGVHTEQIADELQIHNLEDGGVIVHYLPGTDQDIIDQLTSLVNRYSESVILEPYEPMDSMITLTAWSRIEYMQELNEERITSFISTYKGIDHHK